jgi:hypothetical protein
MAKKAAKSSGERESNKSQAIREYMSANPEAGPTSVAQALNEREGWKISAAYVSTIKNKVKDGSGGGRRGRKAGRKAARAASSNGASSMGAGVNEQQLMQAKKLAEQIGSISEAKAALDLLGRLTS